MEEAIISKIIELGGTGIILYFLIRPVMAWMMSRADEKDKYIKSLVEGHFKMDLERHEAFQKSLESLPGTLLAGMAKVYPPDLYGKTDSQLKKIRPKGR